MSVTFKLLQENVFPARDYKIVDPKYVFYIEGKQIIHIKDTPFWVPYFIYHNVKEGSFVTMHIFIKNDEFIKICAPVGSGYNIVKPYNNFGVITRTPGDNFTETTEYKLIDNQYVIAMHNNKELRFEINLSIGDNKILQKYVDERTKSISAIMWGPEPCKPGELAKQSPSSCEPEESRDLCGICHEKSDEFAVTECLSGAFTRFHATTCSKCFSKKAVCAKCGNVPLERFRGSVKL